MNKIQRKINTNKPQFDLKTHVRDGKGNIARENHYRLTIVNGIKEFERPPGSGYIYDEAGTLKRGPKESAQKQEENQVSELSTSSLLKQIEELKSQLAEKEQSTVEKTVNDILVDDVPTVPVSEVDNSEEIALMEKAGATSRAAELKAASKKHTFNKPSYVK